MKFRQFRNENGLTLIELLAALSLFAVVIALSSTVIIQMVSGESSASDDFSLNQHTNVLISEMRRDYINKVNTSDVSQEFNICYQTDAVQIKKMEINNDPVTIENSCTNSTYNQKEFLHVELTTQNESDEFSLETTLNTQKPEKLSLKLTNIDDESIDDEDDFEDIDSGEEDSYTPGNTIPSWGERICDFYGNTSFTQTQIGDWNACEYTTIHDGNGWFKKGISIYQGMHVKVDKDLFVDGQFNLEHNADLIVNKDAKLNGRSTLKSNSTMQVNNLYVPNAFTLQENTALTATGSVKVNNDLKVMSRAEFNITGGLFANGSTTFQEDTKINIGNNAKFNSSVNLMSNAYLFINGNATFNSNLNFQQNSRITIKGNAHFKGSITPNWDAGSMCITGNATFDQELSSNLTQIETEECFNPEGHAIYIVK